MTDQDGAGGTQSLRVTPLTWTPHPDHYAALAARNDYLTSYVAAGAADDIDWDAADTDLPPGFADVMAGIGDSLVDERHRGWAAGYADTDDEAVVEMHARTKAFVEMLLERAHFGPFEHPHAVFAVESISRACMAQLTRHRHASFDVQSFRYTSPNLDHIEAMASGAAPLVEMTEYVVTPRIIERLAERTDDDDETDWRAWYWGRQLNAFTAYADAVTAAVDAGIPEKRAKEDARYFLPQGAKVNLVVSTNLRQWLHIADVRAKGNAHWEIRELTERLLDLVAGWAPMTMDYYEREMAGRRNALAP